MMQSLALSNVDLDNLALRADEEKGERMMRELHNFLGRFVSYPNAHAHTAHALWCVHTHMMDRWESTPRLAFLSAEPGSGKSRSLEITEMVVPNPVLAVNVSPAYLFRKVGCDEAATILYDEIDTVFGPKAKENEEIRGLLNAGHRRGAVAGRCVVRGKAVETEEIPAYAAVALAGLGWLPDTILSRSIIIRMKRRRASERVEPFRRRIHAPEGLRIKTMIEVWAGSAATNWPNMPVEIQDRDADVWEPLLAIADAVGGAWPAKAREAALFLVAASKDATPSLGVKLLADIRQLFTADEMSSKGLIRALLEIEDSPWGDMRGKPLDERGLARRLASYEIKPRTVRIGSTTPKGYRREDFVDVWLRYLPLSPDNTATSATSAADGGYVADVADVADLADGWRGAYEADGPRLIEDRD